MSDESGLGGSRVSLHLELGFLVWCFTKGVNLPAMKKFPINSSEKP